MSLLRNLALALVRKLLPETAGPGAALARRGDDRSQLTRPEYAPPPGGYPHTIHAPPVRYIDLQPPPPRRRKVTVTETIYTERKW